MPGKSLVHRPEAKWTVDPSALQGFDGQNADRNLNPMTSRPLAGRFGAGADTSVHTVTVQYPFIQPEHVERVSIHTNKIMKAVQGPRLRLGALANLLPRSTDLTLPEGQYRSSPELRLDLSAAPPAGSHGLCKILHDLHPTYS